MFPLVLLIVSDGLTWGHGYIGGWGKLFRIPLEPVDPCNGRGTHGSSAGVPEGAADIQERKTRVSARAKARASDEALWLAARASKCSQRRHFYGALNLTLQSLNPGCLPSGLKNRIDKLSEAGIRCVSGMIFHQARGALRIKQQLEGKVCRCFCRPAGIEYEAGVSGKRFAGRGISRGARLAKSAGEIQEVSMSPA